MTKHVKDAPGKPAKADAGKPAAKEAAGKPPVKEDASKSDFRHLVRVSGVVLNGNLDIVRALTHIKGIGQRMSVSLVSTMGIDPRIKLGSLTEAQVEEVEEGIKGIDKKLPAWMLNRQKDRYGGDNLHLTGPDLDMSVREDINLQKSIRSYKGVRHSLGLPVRGQRTRTSFRTGSTIGVTRKKVAEAAAAAKKEGDKEKK
jgi:small subunit ribosomal protein S13